MYRVISYVVEEVVCHDQCVFLTKLLALPCFILYYKATLAYTPWISWLPTLSTKVRLVKTMVLRCKSWIIKKAEHWRIGALMKGLMLKLKFWYFSHMMRRTWLIGKDPDAGKDWWKEEKGTTGDEMVAWHHRLLGHEFEQAPGDGEKQGSLACCSPWGRHKESTWLSNWTIKNYNRVKNHPWLKLLCFKTLIYLSIG